jgi:hypothetical protein
MTRILKSLLLIPFIASPMAFAQFSEQRLSVDQYKWVGPLRSVQPSTAVPSHQQAPEAHIDPACRGRLQMSHKPGLGPVASWLVQPSVRVGQTVHKTPKTKPVAGGFLQAGIRWEQINYSPIDRGSRVTDQIPVARRAMMTIVATCITP